MSLSGIVTYTPVESQIITSALLAVGAMDAFEQLSNTDLIVCQPFLNFLLKNFENQARHIWKRVEGYLFLQNSQYQYTLGGTYSDIAVSAFIATTVAINQAANTNKLSIESSTGFVVGYGVGVVDVEQDLEWFTISSIGTDAFGNPQLTLSGNLSEIVGAGANVYCYNQANLISKPLEIHSVRARDMTNISQPYDILIRQTAYDDYQMLPNKGYSGSSFPVLWTYNKYLANDAFFVWPVPNAVSNILCFTYAPPIQSMIATNNQPDLPDEWILALVLNLAVLIAPAYGKTGTQAYQDLVMQANAAMGTALSFDSDESYIQFKPDGSLIK